MAIVYYPSNASVYTRQVAGGLTEQTIGLTPDTIFIFTTSSLGFTSSIMYGNSASWASSSYSSSYALSASYAPGSPSVSASYALTASWAPSTPNNFSVSSSFSSASISSSYATSASYAPGSPSVSASYALTSSYALSASYAPGNPSVSASYALTASFALNGGGGGTSLTTGSTYPITSSWSLTSSYLAGTANANLFVKSPTRQWFGPTGNVVVGDGISIFGDAFTVYDTTNNIWILYYFCTTPTPVSTFYITASLLEGPWSTPVQVTSLNLYHKFVFLVDENGVPQNINGYYHGYAAYYNGGPNDKEISHFSSSNLTGPWTIGTKTIPRGASGSLDDYTTDTPYAIYKNGQCYMWYMGAPAGAVPTYGLAVRMLSATASNPGAVFTKSYVDVMTPGNTGSWDYGWMGGTQIRLCSDNTYMMVYNAGNTRPTSAGTEPNISAIGYAYSNTLTGPWQKDESNPYCSPVGIPSDGGLTVESTNIWRGHMQYDFISKRWILFYNTGPLGAEKITYARAGVYDYFDSHAGTPYFIQYIRTNIAQISNSMVNVPPGIYRVCYQYNIGDLSTNKPAVDIDTALRVNGTAYRTNRDFVGSYDYENRDTILNYIVYVPTSGQLDCTVQCTNGTPSNATQIRRLRVNVEKIN